MYKLSSGAKQEGVASATFLLHRKVCFTLLAFLILTEVRGREHVKRTWRELYGTNQYIPKPLLSHL